MNKKEEVPASAANELLYRIVRDHDHPPRPFPQRRRARACRSCGSRFVAAGAFERLCPSCRATLKKRGQSRKGSGAGPRN